MYYKDLTEYSYYLPYSLNRVLNIGWIDKNHDFTVGHSDPVLLSKLCETALGMHSTRDYHVNIIRGQHPCAICMRDIYIGNESLSDIPLGASELWIPGRGLWYASPSLVLHYIERHDYLPPLEFIQAVVNLDLSCQCVMQNVYDRLVAEK